MSAVLHRLWQKVDMAVSSTPPSSNLGGSPILRIELFLLTLTSAVVMVGGGWWSDLEVVGLFLVLLLVKGISEGEVAPLLLLVDMATLRLRAWCSDRSSSSALRQLSTLRQVVPSLMVSLAALLRSSVTAVVENESVVFSVFF